MGGNRGVIELDTPQVRPILSRWRSSRRRIRLDVRSIEISGSDGAGTSRLLILLALQARAKGRPVLFMHDRWDVSTRGALEFFGFGLGRKTAYLQELPRYRTGSWDVDMDCYIGEITLAKNFADEHSDGMILIDKRVASSGPPVNNALASEILDNLSDAFTGQVVSAGFHGEGRQGALILGRSSQPWIPKPLGDDWRARERISNLGTGEFLLQSGVELLPVTVPDLLVPGWIPGIEGPFIKIDKLRM